MEQRLSTPPQPEPENKCLGSLFMKLEGTLVQQELPGDFKLKSEPAQTEQLKLYLTLQFKEQRELLVDGHIKFGLKGGQLRVKLKNAQLPLTSSESARLFEVCLPNKGQSSETSGNKTDVEDSLLERKPGVKTNSDTQKTVQRTERSQSTCCQVVVKGSQENPVWVFEVDGESVLQGLFKNVALATLDVVAKPCYVEATFEVSPRDVHLAEAEGLWPKNISKKKIAVIKRAIARHFLEQKLKPYLSRQLLRYD
ncbi:MAG TPA: hypothetical protein V6D43_25995 [Candidatus Sericytochromatia bacterium]|jgi:hypothetical protein